MARPAIVSSLVFVRLSVLLSWYLVTCALTETKVSQLFVKQTLCPGKVVSLDQCPVSGSAGVMGGCSLQCAKRSDCLSFLWDRVQHVCHLCTRIVSNDCVTNTQDQMGLEAYEKTQTCGQGAMQPAVTNGCQCLEYATGDLCQNIMRDCEDWRVAGFPDGVYWIRPSPSQAAFRVKCRMQHNRTYLMWRENSAFDFYRGWDEYANGFGDLSGDYWLGLIHMSSLTNTMCYNLFVQANVADHTWYQTGYEAITVADASQNFALGFSAYIELRIPLGDCLIEVKGRPFSTYDADHDGDVSTNCAQRHESGWWMGTLSGIGCTLCNPTGRLLQPADMKRTNQDKEVFWTPFRDGTIVPKTIAMWVKRC